MNIILLGPQGSGKGTQAELLVQKFGFLHFEMGAFLRDVAKTNPEVDEMVNKKGVLVPDELTDKLVREHLGTLNKYDGILFDGFPRTKVQYELLNKLLSEHDEDVDLVFLIDIPEEETVKRLSARRMDPATGKIYNLITNPPGPELDASSLVQREDDRPEAIKKRLEAYRNTTLKVAEEAKLAGKLILIDGVQVIPEIHAQIANFIDGFLQKK